MTYLHAYNAVAAEGILKCCAKTEMPAAAGAKIESPKAFRGEVLGWGHWVSSSPFH